MSNFKIQGIRPLAPVSDAHALRGIYNTVRLLPLYLTQSRRQRGQWCPASHLKYVPPHFMFGPPVAAYIKYCV